MNNQIYPCLWFNGEAREAANFYSSIFKDTHILNDNGMVCNFSIQGAKIMALNGGPQYQKNNSISFFVYCGNMDEIDRIYAALMDGGSAVMPLMQYDWSERYAWVTDRFGVNWQLDVEDIRSDQKIVPNLLFSGKKNASVQEAIHFYTQIFPDSSILLESPYNGDSGLPKGSLIFAQVKLNGYILNVMSSPLPQETDFNPAISIVVECDQQNQIDHYWEKLGENGHYSMCGWLEDLYGVSWQIIPSKLSEWMTDSQKAPKIIEKFQKTQKFEIDQFENI